MKSAFTTWLLLIGLLLQSVAWALPAQRAGQAERLAHEVAHAIDHGHHRHPGHIERFTLQDESGHDIDPALLLDAAPDTSPHGPHHFHASEGGQLQGLPLTDPAWATPLAPGLPRAASPLQPPSAVPDGLLRPPQRPV